jgi:transcriptional regulator with GAF, ATPase, and Fis domain
MLSPSESNALVLIVEDEFLIADDLGDVLESAGYQVVGLAESAAEARTMVAETRPSVVLLDIFLKGKETGIELAHWLNQQQIPFVFLSANLTDDMLEAAKVTEPFGFLNKPFRERDVLAALEIARYRHAHSQEAKLRQQQQIQIAVNDAIVTLHDREQLCRAIATQVDQFVPFTLLNLCISLPDEQSTYWMMLRKTEPGTFVRVGLAELLGPENSSELLEALNHPNPTTAQLSEQQGIFTGPSFTDLCQRYPTAQAIRQAFGIQSMALFPVTLKQRSFISLQLATTAADGFTADDYATVGLIIPQIALALDNMLAYEQLETRRRFKEAELAVASAFRNGRNIAEIAPQVAEAISKLLPIDLLSFYRVGRVLGSPNVMDATVGKQDGQFRLLFMEDIPLPESIRASEVALANLASQLLQPKLNVGEAAAQGSELDEVSRYSRDLLQRKSSMCVPITLKDQPVAVLVVASKAAYAFTNKDLNMLQELASQLALALENLLAYERIRLLSEQLEQEKTYLSEELKTSHNFEEIIGTSPALLAVLRGVGQVAPTDATVLLLGETGTGKELIARAVHSRSPRSSRTMVKVNCAALPPQLMESELFGHERGSFTGATERRVGKFELAHGSTIFLDEIGELPLELQAKLLRVVQEKEIERIGGKEAIVVDVRIIAATNRELAEEVAAGRFRTDLYYRLNVFPLVLPPLRTRPEDLLPLATYCLRKLSQKLGKPFTSIANDSLQQIQRYAWPGNIRELENVLERAAILSTPPTLVLAEPLVPSTPQVREVKPMEDTLRETILAVLAQTNYRIRGPRGAATLLGVKATTLEARMKKLGIASRKESRPA